MRRALQRQPGKHPHKSSSQRLGARTLNRQHWRKAASLERHKYRTVIYSDSSTGHIDIALRGGYDG